MKKGTYLFLVNIAINRNLVKYIKGVQNMILVLKDMFKKGYKT